MAFPEIPSSYPRVGTNERLAVKRKLVDPQDVAVAEQASRQVRTAHVRLLKADMQAKGFLEGLGRITISEAPTHGSSPSVQPYIVVDGMHRLTALKELRTQGRFKSVPMSLVTTVRGQAPLTMCDILALAASLNTSAHVIAKVSFFDRVHISMSYIDAFMQLRPAGSPSLRLGVLATNMMNLGILAPYQFIVCRRYVRVAFALRESPEASRLLGELAAEAGDESCGLRSEYLACRLWTSASDGMKSNMLKALCKRWEKLRALASLKAPLDTKFFELVAALVGELSRIDTVDVSYHRSGKYVDLLYLLTSAWRPSVLEVKGSQYDVELRSYLQLFAAALSTWSTSGTRPTCVDKPDLDAACFPLIVGGSRLSSQAAAAPAAKTQSTAAKTAPSSALRGSGALPTPDPSPDLSLLGASGVFRGTHAVVALSGQQDAGSSTASVGQGVASAITAAPQIMPAAGTSAALQTLTTTGSAASVHSLARDSVRSGGNSGKIAASSSAGTSQVMPSLRDARKRPIAQTLKANAVESQGKAVSDGAVEDAPTDDDDDNTVTDGGAEAGSPTPNANPKRVRRGSLRSSRSTAAAGSLQEEDGDAPFDDVQQNPPPTDAADRAVAHALPEMLEKTRAKWYLTRAEVASLSKELVDNAAAFDLVELMYGRAHAASSPELLICLSDIYFLRAAEELRQQGFVVLDGILQRTSIADDLDGLLKHFAAAFSGVGVSKGAADPWENIYNGSDSAQEARLEKSRTGRMTVPRKHLADDLEVKFPHLYAAKLRIEFAIARLLQFVAEDPSTLRFPATGSRLLMTVGSESGECPAQRPHVDFELSPAPAANPWTLRPNPHYFAMVSAAQPFPLRVWPGSHILSNGPGKRVQAVTRQAPSRLVDVSNYSVLICRGDLFHGGASGEETNKNARDPPNVRLHLYATRDGVKVLDAVHLPKNCEFRNQN
jgi:hypothetical protein